MRQFIFDYEWNGSTYSLTIPARDLTEATMRAAAMERGPLVYKGELMATVKVSNFERGWWARFVKFVLGVKP